MNRCKAISKIRMIGFDLFGNETRYHFRYHWKIYLMVEKVEVFVLCIFIPEIDVIMSKYVCSDGI